MDINYAYIQQNLDPPAVVEQKQSNEPENLAQIIQISIPCTTNITKSELEEINKRIEDTTKIPVLDKNTTQRIVKYEILINPEDDSLVGGLKYAFDEKTKNNRLENILFFRGHNENPLLIVYKPDLDHNFDRNEPKNVLHRCEEDRGDYKALIESFYSSYKEEKDLRRRKQERKKYKGRIETASMKRYLYPTNLPNRKFRRWF